MPQLWTRHRPARLATYGFGMAVLLTVAAGCTANEDDDATNGNASSPASAVTAASFVTPATTHADPDDGDYRTDGATTIALKDGATAVRGDGATVKGDVVTVSRAGTYVVSGTLTNGQVVVDSSGDGTVQIVLDGAGITSRTTSPLVVTEADEAVVVLADGTTSTLSDAAASAADDEKDDAPTATLFSMADLTIAGNGTLRVSGKSNDGIGSKDGLVVLGGTIDVTATDDGVRGKDYLVVQAGTVTVDAGGDGLKADNDDTAEPGWFQLDGGTATVTAKSDGVDAVGAINVGAGSLTVTGSDEGLEAARITLAGGTVDVTATDDGLNATDGSVEGGGEAVQDGVLLTISGGDVHVRVEQGDGIDSNGSAIVTGGTTVVDAADARGGGTGSLDANGEFPVNGGTLIALGGISTQPATGSTQGWVAASLSIPAAAGQVLTVTDADQKVVVSHRVDRATSSVVVAADGIENGETYTLSVGDTAGATVTAGVASAGGGGRGPGGGNRGGPGGGPGGGAPTPR